MGGHTVRELRSDMFKVWKNLSKTYKIALLMLLFIMFVQLSTLFYIWKVESYVLLKKEQKNLEYQLEVDANFLLNHLKGLKKELEFLSILELMDDLLTNDIDKRIGVLLTKKANDMGQGILLVAKREGRVVSTSQKRYNEKNYFIFHVSIFASFDRAKKIGELELLYPYEKLSHIAINNPSQKLWLTPPIAIDGFFIPSVKESIVVSKYLNSTLRGWRLSLAYEKEEALHSIKEIEKVLLYAFLISLGVLLFVVWRLSIRQIDILKYTEEIVVLKQTFLSTMSHELRTPLGSILNLLQHLMVNPKMEEEELDILSKIENASEHLLEMINNLLQLSKIESNSMPIVKESIDIVALIEEMIEIVEPLIEEKSLELKVNLPYSPQIIFMDIQIFKQIVMNLLSNAVKYTHKGSIEIYLEKREENYLLRLIDTGVGIDKEQQVNLFSEFYQASNGKREIRHSCGLGLALSQKMAHLIGAEIRLKSDGINRGAEATFSFSSLSSEI